MRKIKIEISLFLKKETTLCWIFIMSFFIYVSYYISKDLGEWFEGAEFIYKLISDLSLAYMGSFIFYIVQVYTPEYKKMKKMKNNINYYLSEILDSMNHIYVDMCHDYLDEQVNLINTVITESQFKKIETKFDLNDKVKLDWDIELTYYEYILNSIYKVEKNIDKIYIRLGGYIDEEIKLLLIDITNSSLHGNFEKIDAEYPSSIYWGQITKYYRLYRRLYIYIYQ